MWEGESMKSVKREDVTSGNHRFEIQEGSPSSGAERLDGEELPLLHLGGLAPLDDRHALSGVDLRCQRMEPVMESVGLPNPSRLERSFDPALQVPGSPGMGRWSGR